MVTCTVGTHSWGHDTRSVDRQFHIPTPGGIEGIGGPRAVKPASVLALKGEWTNLARQFSSEVFHYCRATLLFSLGARDSGASPGRGARLRGAAIMKNFDRKQGGSRWPSG